MFNGVMRMAFRGPFRLVLLIGAFLSKLYELQSRLCVLRHRLRKTGFENPLMDKARVAGAIAFIARKPTLWLKQIGPERRSVRLQDLRVVKTISASCRRRRLTLLEKLLHELSPPIRLLDVGGTQEFWETVEFCHRPGIEIVLLNTWAIQPRYENFRSVIGDARNMSQFRDQEFDVVFSNSAIEHVGSFEDQHRVANEMIRVGKRLFVQTPNRHFAIEPHFLFPCFQFLPVAVRVWLASRFDLGRWSTSERSDPAFRVDSVRLLSKRELRELFPRAEIVCERLAGLPKSFLVLENWQAPGIKPNEIAF